MTADSPLPEELAPAPSEPADQPRTLAGSLASATRCLTLPDWAGSSPDKPVPLTLRQHGLIAETRGIIKAMQEGTIPTGQSRLRDNLLEILTLFPQPQPEAAPEQRRLLHQFAGVIQIALEILSGCGATTEGLDLNTLGQRRGAAGRQLA